MWPTQTELIDYGVIIAARAVLTMLIVVLFDGAWTDVLRSLWMDAFGLALVLLVKPWLQVLLAVVTTTRRSMLTSEMQKSRERRRKVVVKR